MDYVSIEEVNAQVQDNQKRATASRLRNLIRQTSSDLRLTPEGLQGSTIKCIVWSSREVIIITSDGRYIKFNLDADPAGSMDLYTQNLSIDEMIKYDFVDAETLAQLKEANRAVTKVDAVRNANAAIQHVIQRYGIEKVTEQLTNWTPAATTTVGDY